MDCPDYLNQLDAVLPGSEDHEDPGVREAVAHLSECERCAREFQVRQEFDGQVALQMRDVAVPSEARERLLQELGQSSRTEASPAPTPTGGRGLKRSLMWKSLVATAALLVLGLIGYLGSRPSPDMTMTQVHEKVATQFSSVTIQQYDNLELFDDRFDATFDDGRWNLVTNSNPRGIDLDGEDGHDAAVYWINGPVTGVLLVLPAERVQVPPGNQSPIGVAPLYSPVRVAWMPDGSKKVHLCVLNGDADESDLNRLLRSVLNSMTA